VGTLCSDKAVSTPDFSWPHSTGLIGFNRNPASERNTLVSTPTTDELWLSLDPEEKAAVTALQQEMELESPTAVMHALLRQAAQRALVVCPSCGHSARKTNADEASCIECMSVLHLSDGIWQIIAVQ
jgi:hypothetical protein